LRQRRKQPQDYSTPKDGLILGIDPPCFKACFGKSGKNIDLIISAVLIKSR